MQLSCVVTPDNKVKIHIIDVGSGGPAIAADPHRGPRYKFYNYGAKTRMRKDAEKQQEKSATDNFRQNYNQQHNKQNYGKSQGENNSQKSPYTGYRDHRSPPGQQSHEISAITVAQQQSTEKHNCSGAYKKNTEPENCNRKMQSELGATCIDWLKNV